MVKIIVRRHTLKLLLLVWDQLITRLVFLDFVLEKHHYATALMPEEKKILGKLK